MHRYNTFCGLLTEFKMATDMNSVREYRAMYLNALKEVTKAARPSLK